MSSSNAIPTAKEAEPAAIGRFGTFARGDVEAAFRSAKLADDKARMLRIIPLLLAAAAIYIFNDLRIVGFSPLFWSILAWRAFAIVFLLTLAYLVKRAQRPVELDASVLVLLLVCITLNAWLQGTRPPAYTAYIQLDPLFVFVVYSAVPAALRMQMASAGLLSALAFAVYILTKSPQDGSTFGSIAVAHGLAHAVGIMTSFELHKRKRMEYADRVRESELRRSLEASEAKHRETQQVARLGGWEFDLRTQHVVWSEEVYRLYGRDPELGPPTYSEFLALVPGSHKERLRSAVDRALTAGIPYSLEHEMDVPGGPRFVRGTGQPIVDEHGEVVRLVGTVQDITEQKDAQEKMLAAKEAAENAMRAKSDFLAMMSHELRTPMNGVLGMAELLADTPLNAEQRDYLDTIQTSGESLLHVINDILDFSKVEAGKLVIEFIDFDVVTVVRECVQIVEAGARQKGLAIELLLDRAPSGFLNGDPGRLRQILMNLLSNAVKFTETGSIQVEVRCETEKAGEQNVYFSVKDSGIGISEAVQKNLFQSFTQGDSSTTRQYGGTGLGLAICRRLTELMGGTIGVESAPGKGSTFWFQVPFGVSPVKTASEIQKL